MSDDDRLNELLDRWEELIDRGESIDPAKICRDSPELLDEFVRQIKKLRSMDVLMSSEDSRSASSTFLNAESHDPSQIGHVESMISRIRAGRYVPVRFLAEGGLGRLFVARDTELNRDVVLKLIKNEILADRETRRRFESEAEITSQLDHPGIVPVYGFGRDERSDGREYPFYAMRLIRGQRLEDAIHSFHAAERSERDENLGMQKLLRCFLTVCETMAFAHSRGIIHRDLKPANIMLGEYGETLVVDWGLAKNIRKSSQSEDEPELALNRQFEAQFDLTQAGSLKGTLAYMSPEQARGQWDIVGASSDIYSLGAVLYTILTGQKAFTDPDIYTVHKNVIHGRFTAPRQIIKRIPAALEQICLKAMRIDPAERYLSAVDLSRDIEQWLADEPVSAWKEPWYYGLRRWCRRHSTGLISAAVAMTVAVIGLLVANTVLNEKNQQLLQANHRAEESFDQANHAVRDIVDQACGNPLLRKPGMHRAQESLLRVALEYYRDFTKQRSNDPRLHEEMLSARLEIAKIVHDLRSPQEAEDEYQSVAEFLESLLRNRPGHQEFRKQLALVHSRLSQIDLELGHVDANQSHFAQSESAYQKLIQESPSDSNLRLAYANAAFLQGEETNDLKILERARDLIEDASTPPLSLNGEAPLLLARVCNQIALVEMRSARLAKAAVALDRAQELIANHGQTSSDVDSTDFDAIQSSIALNQGRLAKLQGDTFKTASYLQTALKGFQSLVHRDPEMPEFHLRLATTLLELGKQKLAMGDGDQALQDLSAARNELNAQPNTSLRVLDRYELARSLLDLGEAMLKAGDIDQAQLLFVQSQQQFQSLVAINSKDPDFRRNHAATWNQIAAVEQRSGDVEACIAALNNARKELEAITVSHPERPEFRNALAKVCFNLGAVEFSQNRSAGGRLWFQQARDIYDAQILLHPDIAEYQSDRTQFLQRMISICRSQQRQLHESNDEPAEQVKLLEATLSAIEALRQNPSLTPQFQELMNEVRADLENARKKAD